MKFAYNQILEIAPTCGLEVPEGEVRIVGIMHPSHLPTYIDLNSWLTGDPNGDWETQTSPWYFLEYGDDTDGFDTFDLPEWALEEVVRKSNKNKVRKHFNLDTSEQNAIR